MNLTFRSHERLRRKRDFARVRRTGRRRTGRWLVLWACPRVETPARANRLGIVVGRKHGGAVQRNLFKRRLRETYRLNKAAWPRGWDLIVMPKAGGPAFPPPFAALSADFIALMNLALRDVK